MEDERSGFKDFTEILVGIKGGFSERNFLFKALFKIILKVK